MKKRLLLLTILGGFLLSGCRITIGNKVIKLFEKDEKQENNNQNNNNNNQQGENGGNQQGGEGEKKDYIMREYGDYKLAENVVDGGRYLLGIHRTHGANEGQTRFFNGDYHRDGNKAYSFYLGTSQSVDNDVSFAAEIEVNFVNETEFTMKVHAEGKVWDNKYIGLYPAKGTSRFTISTCLLDTLDQKTFNVVNGTNESQVTSEDVITTYKYFDKVDDTEVKTIAATYCYSDAGDTEPTQKFFGTSADYISFDVKSYPEAIDYEQYDLAHLYVHK